MAILLAFNNFVSFVCCVPQRANLHMARSLSLHYFFISGGTKPRAALGTMMDGYVYMDGMEWHESTGL